MFADADHEVIDSPEALFHHLYEEHGVEEARDLDPGTAPLQFWLRRHADLERAQRATRGRDAPAPEPRQRPAPPPEPAVAGRDGRRPAGFGDPLVEAMARALAGRGHDEASVRSAIRSFDGGDRELTGEAGVRAAFVEPLLRTVAEQLLGAGGPPRPPARPRPEPVRPEAAWAVLWADLADTGTRAGEGPGSGGEDGDDLMAVANAVQARRRVRLLRR